MRALIAGAGTARGAPLLPGLKPNMWYHTSALAAACIDTATLPYRVSGAAGAVGGAEMRSMARHLSARAGGRAAQSPPVILNFSTVEVSGVKDKVAQVQLKMGTIARLPRLPQRCWS